MTIAGFIRRWRRVRVRRASDKHISELRTALDRLGYGWWPVPLSLRAAIRQISGTSLGALLYAEALTLGAGTAAIYLYWGFTAEAQYVPLRAAIEFIAWTLLITSTAAATRDTHLAANRCRLVMQCIETIKACAEAYGAGGERRTGRLRALSGSLRSLERIVLRAYRTRGTVPHLSPRRAELRRHAGQVVARLRAAESRLDGGDQAQALEELAGLIVTITENYIAGHVGALLSPATLTTFEPVPDRELLRIGAAVTLIAGSAVVVSLLGLPDMPAAVMVAAVGILALLVLFGRHWHRYLPLAEFFKPGP
ncbi:hypothetical protein ACFVJH_18900 [Streptomyces decoyicus]|uniref:hypothetical protein n=1 Tax=Streptomyces decoyicus TaxID=249567 RepID=UPI00363D16CB